MIATRYESLADRTVIVTRGASGIGEAIVRGFCGNGARVGFLDVDTEASEALAQETGARFVPCDLRDIPAVQAAIQENWTKLGPAAVLVNNAANDRRIPFADLTETLYDEMMAVNFRHVVFASKAVPQQMRSIGGRSIVNMSSVAWMGGGREMELYAAAKAAIVGFINALARDAGPDRISVNAIAPGMVITPRQRKLWFQDEARIVAGISPVLAGFDYHGGCDKSCSLPVRR